MTITHTLIQSYTVPSAVSSVTLSAISQSFDHLIIKTSVRTNRFVDGFADVGIRINSNTSSIYKAGAMQSNGSSVAAIAAQTSISIGNFLMSSVNGFPDIFGSGEIFLPNYKSGVSKIFRLESYTEINQTNAITRIIYAQADTGVNVSSITFIDNNSSFIQPNSTFQIYGLTNS